MEEIISRKELVEILEQAMALILDKVITDDGVICCDMHALAWEQLGRKLDELHHDLVGHYYIKVTDEEDIRNKVLALSDEAIEKIEEDGVEVVRMTAEQFEELIREQFEKAKKASMN